MWVQLPHIAIPNKIIGEILVMTESYKTKSKIATAAAFIAAFIVYIGEPGLSEIIPSEYAKIIPVIVFIAGYILTQTTENKRVATAEQITKEKYTTVEAEEPVLNDEYEVDADDQ